jgi:beta-glucuronidase
MVRLADRLGLLVWEEIPVYWATAWENPATLENAKQQLSDVIARDHNRAAVVLWSVANETPLDPARLVFLKALVAQARDLDHTRLITAALNHFDRPAPNTIALTDPLADVLDVIGLNEYLGWYGKHQLAMLRKIPSLAGYSPWVLMDFRSPRRLLPGVQDYYNRKGLISDRGERKQAFYVLQDFYRQMKNAAAR